MPPPPPPPKKKTKSLRSNPREMTRMTRIEFEFLWPEWLFGETSLVFFHRGAGAAKFWVEEWTNNPRESIYSPSHLWRSRPASWEWRLRRLCKIVYSWHLLCSGVLVWCFVCVFLSFNVSWSLKVTSLEVFQEGLDSQYSPPVYNSEASQHIKLQGLSNRPSRWRT